jgi:tRNA A37 threonylcarbamoyladenosine dehydratase
MSCIIPARLEVEDPDPGLLPGQKVGRNHVPTRIDSMARFDRLVRLIGKQGLSRLADSSVAVFGLGGVGSFAAEGLVRGGIGHLTLVDHDLVEISNFNRQIEALEGTLGQPKAVVMAARCHAINPAVHTEPFQVRYGADTAEGLLNQPFDYVLDCIDQVTAKLHLIESCLQRQLPIISSMGAANKLDPTGIQIADLFETSRCGLARIMRKELRRRGITRGVTVVYSTAPTTMNDRDCCADRATPLGSSSIVPPLFGLTMAGKVIQILLAKENP